jgi:hypothetical protein
MNLLPSYRISETECDLKVYWINSTETGYDSLKKNSSNVAICCFIPEEQHYLLGIKSKYQRDGVKLLLNNQTSLSNQCPYDYIPRFRGRDWNHTFYEWWYCDSKPLIIATFNWLDAHVNNQGLLA